MSISRDIVYYAFIKGVGVLYWMLLIKLSALHLNPEEFGYFSIAFSISTVVAILWTGWQSSSLLRFYHEDSDKLLLYKTLVNGLVRSAIWVSLGWLIVFALVKLISTDVNFKIVLLAFPLSVAYGLHLFVVNMLRIKRDLKKILLLNIVQALIVIGMFITLVDYYNWAAAVMALILAYSLSLFAARHKSSLIKSALTHLKNEKFKKKLMSYGLPVVSIGIISQLLSTSDLLILKMYGYVEEVGIYSANYNIAEKSIFAILAIIVSAFVPIIYKKSTLPDFNIRKEIRKINVFFLVIAIPFVVAIWFLAPQLSALFLEERYISGGFIIPLVSVAGIFVGVASFYSEVFTLAEKTRVLAKIYLAALIVNIALNLLFVKNFGMIAAVYSTVFSYLLLMIFIFFQSRKYD